MTIFLALIVCATAGAEPDDSGLEEAFRRGGAAGFLAVVRELKQEQGPEPTAKALVRLTSDRDGDRELRATAAHAIGQMPEAGRTVLPELAEAFYKDFPADRLNELGAGDIPLWLAEVLLRPDDPSLDDAGFALATKLDLRKEERLLPLLIQAAGPTQAYAEIWQREYAIRALGKMGDSAASSRPLLADLLKKEPEEDVEPDVKKAWNDKDAGNYVRGYAAWALGEIGAEPESTAQLFTGMLDHPDQVIRDWCALGLALLDRKQNPARAAKTLVELLSGNDGDDQHLRAVTVHTIGRMGEAGKAVLPELAKALDDDGLPIMWYMYGEYDLGDIPLWYAEVLLRPDDPSFEYVGFDLGSMAALEHDQRVFPLLIQGARHANLDVRDSAVGALGDMGKMAASAQPLLVEILKTEPPGDLTPGLKTRWNDIRGSAAYSLGQIGAEPESTVQLLAEMLGHPDERIWSRSALGLAWMGEEAAPAIPALVEALGRYNYIQGGRVDHVAASALCNIGEPAIPALIGALQSDQTAVRRRAAKALFWSAHMKSALGAVIKAATEDEDQHVRLTAIQALNFRSSSFQDDARLLPAAIRLLEDTSPKVRACAVRLLGGWDRPEEVPLPPLVDLLNDPNAKVRLAAIEAVFRLSPQAEEIAPALERVLSDPDKNVRYSARKLLERINKE